MTGRGDGADPPNRVVGPPSLGAAEIDGMAYVQAINRVPLWYESVGDALVRVSRIHGDVPALVWLTDSGSQTMTWGELASAASSKAAELISVNPTRRRVIVAAPNSAAWVIAVYGCALAGMPVVPISPFATDDELAAIVAHCKPSTILACDRVGDHTVKERLAAFAATMADGPTVLDIALQTATAQAQLTGAPVDPDGEFLVQYTSGTTGNPKAASLSHTAVLNCARFFADGAGARRGDRWLNPLPVHHVGGFVSGVLACLASACAYVVIERFSTDLVLRALRLTRPALVGMVPTMLIDLLSERLASADDFSSVRVIIGGATDVDPALVDDVETRLGIQFLVGYGQSESPCMSMSVGTDESLTRTRTLGHPLPGRDYYVGDRTGRVQPVDHEGELYVRGPLNMLGYLGADGRLPASTDVMSWRGTGDLCVLDIGGVLTFRGRARDVIIRGGTNIYPAEVEHAISTYPGVAEVAVFGVADPRLGQRVVAAVTQRSDSVIDWSGIEAHTNSLLSRQKRPAEYVRVESFPRTASGKIRKHVLERMYRDGECVPM